MQPDGCWRTRRSQPLTTMVGHELWIDPRLRCSTIGSVPAISESGTPTSGADPELIRTAPHVHIRPTVDEFILTLDDGSVQTLDELEATVLTICRRPLKRSELLGLLIEITDKEPSVVVRAIDRLMRLNALLPV